MNAYPKLHNGLRYDVEYTAKNVIEWLVCRYTVTAGGGAVVGMCTTRWGARRIIAAHERMRADAIEAARMAVKP